MAVLAEATKEKTFSREMKIGLFIPCYIDLIYPEAGVASQPEPWTFLSMLRPLPNGGFASRPPVLLRFTIFLLAWACLRPQWRCN